MPAQPSQDYRDRVGRAVRWLEQHLHEDVRPEALAKVAAFSPYHFHRVFKGVTGESVMACRRRLRLEWAAKRLRHTQLPVVEVALASGYGSHEAFTRAFTARFGSPPQTWRAHPSPRLERPPPSPTAPLAPAEVRVVGPRPFLHLREVGPYTDVGPTWATFLGLAGQAGWYTGEQTLMGRYFDDPEVTAPEQMRYDVGLIPTRPGMVAPAGCTLSTVAGGTWAVMVHKGSYDTLAETYLDLVGRWFVHKGLPLADRPCLEVYLNLPGQVPTEDLRTEVWAAVGD